MAVVTLLTLLALVYIHRSMTLITGHITQGIHRCSAMAGVTNQLFVLTL
jgi:hypothetical protein